ncbi:MAG: molybdopterin-dependent oxidoreductase [Myxococcota bacterium]
MTIIKRLDRRHFLGTTTSAFVLARFGPGCAPNDGAPSPRAPSATDAVMATGTAVPPSTDATQRGTEDAVTAMESAKDTGPTPGPDDAVAEAKDVPPLAPIVPEPIPPLTSNEDFYVVSYSGPPEEGWDVDWRLTLGGFEAPVMLELAELQAFGSETVEHTLECIGNSPPGNAISNAEWTGLRLRDLLEALELTVPEGTLWITFACGDGYETFLPFDDDALDLILVWEMNGEPLPAGHGAPLRALVPGRYGMKNPKWIAALAFSNAEEPAGFWESYGWSAEARYRVHSWVHEPDAGDTLSAQGVTLLGSAHAGDVPIARVELSTDGGESWRDAELTYTGPPNAWSLWRFEWTPEASGPYTIVARATDLNGRVQGSDDDAAPLSGWAGQHTLNITVS